MHASTANCVAAAITTLRWDRLYITLHHPFAVRDKNPDHNPPHKQGVMLAKKDTLSITDGDEKASYILMTDDRD